MDWKNIIQDLLDAGMTQADVAQAIGIKPPSLSELINSDSRKGVRWETGNNLIALHKRVMRAQKQAIEDAATEKRAA